jgi:FHS family glucose/mannose:H+ symporter-like MFS transporter
MKSVPVEGSASQVEGHAPLMAMLHGGFVLTGIVNTILGPLLPLLSQGWSLSDAQAGYLFTAQFIGSVAGVVGSSWIVPRAGSRLPLMLGLGAMALGMGTLGFGSSVMGLLSALGMGIGLGLVIPTTNLLVAELNPDKRAAALNFVNFFWGIGAVMSPALVALSQRLNRTALLQYAIAIVLITSALSLKLFGFPARKGAEQPNTSSSDSQVWRSPFVPILGALFFLYVGSEISVGGWVAAYAHRVMVNPGTIWAVMPSFFWAALLLGRAVAPTVLRRIAEEKVARAGLSLAAAGIVLLLIAHAGWALAVSGALAGLGFSSVYPIVIAALSHRFGAMAARVGGLTFTLAGLGGATLPLLVGHLSTRYSSLRVGLVVPLLGCGAMFALHLLLSKPALRPAA